VTETAPQTRNSSSRAEATRFSKAEASALRDFLRGLLRVLRANPLTFVGFILVLILSVLALLVVLVPVVTQLLLGHTILLTPFDPNELTTDYGQPPSTSHFFGTDNLGGDIFSRILTALPLDLAIGFGITGFALLVGGGLGLVAGFWDKPGTIGGVVSLVILRVTDVFC